MLPDKLSDLILISLADLEKCENDPNYRIDMDSWHHFVSLDNAFASISNVCHVCLAGAVAAKSLGIPITADLAFQDEREYKKLIAIDSIRAGQFTLAFYDFYGRLESGDEPARGSAIEELTARDATHGLIGRHDVETKGLALKKRMQEIAGILARHGF